MNKRKINLTIHLEQVVNDLLAKCNQISKSIKEEGMSDIKASISEPDSPENRSIINRSVTEAFGIVKRACQRYMTVGRTDDDNRLERMVKNVVYAKELQDVQEVDDNGNLLFFVTVGDAEPVVAYLNTDNEWIEEETGQPVPIEPSDRVTYEPKMVQKWVETDEITHIEYEDLFLTLEIPNFNLSVTDDLKSNIQTLMVHHILYKFLQDQYKDKAAEYKALSEGDDYRNIISDLNARDNYTMRKPSFM